MEVHYLTDAGATFDDHFDDAFSQLFALGYESVVSVGGDIPTLPKSHITQRSSGSTTSSPSARRASCRRRARNAARR